MSIKHNDVDTDGVSVSSYSGDSAAVVDNSSALKLNKKITRRDFFRSTGVLYAASTMVDVKHARAGDDDDEDSPPPHQWYLQARVQYLGRSTCLPR